MNKVKIALIQMKVTTNKEVNLLKGIELINKAANEGAQIIVLPEMFTTPYDNSYFPEFSEICPGYTTNKLSEAAFNNKIYLIGGSIPELENGKIYNTSFIFDKNGNIIGRHRKVHLFDINIENGVRFMESDTLSPGNSITVCETEYGKIGVAICFDMRFPEQIRLMADEGAIMVIIPAAFNMTTGPAHWHLTARMRAIDNQVFIGLTSPARDLESSYVAYGHSLVCNPWGDVVEELSDCEDILLTEINLDEVYKIREQLPLLKARRHDIYELKQRDRK